jgi:D-psicose/D-tagatose/L-ribulose 3-epimerase
MDILMKFGIHLSTFTPSWDDDALAFIPTVANIGYRMVEIPLMFPNTFDVRMAKEQLRKYHLTCTCGTGLNAREDISSVDSDIRKAGIARLKKCIDITEYLGGDCLGGVLYAPWGERRSRKESKDRYAASMESLQQVADYAQQKGVVLSLELLNRYESFFMNNIEEGLAFLKLINRNNVKLHYDTFHAHIEEKDQTSAIYKGGDKIWHVHLCDNTRGAPGSGSIDFIAILSALQAIGYDRNLVVENFVIPDCESGMEACIWSQKWSTPEQDAREAFGYISAILERVGYGNVG